MSDGQDAFQARIARIKAADTGRRADPTLPPELLSGLPSLRRNASAASGSDLLRGLFDIPTFRYGLPIILALVGLALMSRAVPVGMHRITIAEQVRNGDDSGIRHSTSAMLQSNV